MIIKCSPKILRFSSLKISSINDLIESLINSMIKDIKSEISKRDLISHICFDKYSLKDIFVAECEKEYLYSFCDYLQEVLKEFNSTLFYHEK